MSIFDKISGWFGGKNQGEDSNGMTGGDMGGMPPSEPMDESEKEAPIITPEPGGMPSEEEPMMPEMPADGGEEEKPPME